MKGASPMVVAQCRRPCRRCLPPRRPRLPPPPCVAARSSAAAAAARPTAARPPRPPRLPRPPQVRKPGGESSRVLLPRLEKAGWEGHLSKGREVWVVGAVECMAPLKADYTVQYKVPHVMNNTMHHMVRYMVHCIVHHIVHQMVHHIVHQMVHHIVHTALHGALPRRDTAIAPAAAASRIASGSGRPSTKERCHGYDCGQWL